LFFIQLLHQNSTISSDLQSQRPQTCLTTTKTSSRATKVSSSLKLVTFHEQRSDITQVVATETTAAMTKAAKVVATETIAATRAPAVEVEDIKITPAREVEINRAPQVAVEDMEITPAQEAEITSRAPRVEGKARLNRRESRPLRALLRKKDGRRPSLPLDFETEAHAVWGTLMKNFIVLSSCITIE
jgi:hypothetical protein